MTPFSSAQQISRIVHNDFPVNPIRKKGQWIVINPYFGCEFACSYCRAQLPWRLHFPELAWKGSIEIREHAPEFMKKNPSRFYGRQVLLSTLGDPYTPIEKEKRITRTILELCKEYNARVRIITKSPLVLRDIDVLKTMDVEVGIEIGTTNERMGAIIESNAPAIDARTETLYELRDAGIRTFVHIYPYLPEITPPSMVNIFAEEADFIVISTINFNNTSLKKIFYDTLRKNDPELLIRYQTKYLKNAVYFTQLKKKILQKAEKDGVLVEVLW